MWDFEQKTILGLMSRTMPFLIYRLLVYIGITLVYVAVTGGGAGIGYIAGKVGGDPATGAGYGGMIGFGVASVALYFAREYLLYMVKAGHIVVLVELLDGKTLPEGRGQIEHATVEVKKRFVESSLLFGVDQLIKGILKTFNRIFFSIATFLPIPGLQGITKLVNAVINMSLTYLDEVILAHIVRTQSDNPWQSSQEAIILYAQNYKTILKNAIFLTFIIWGLTLLVFLLVLGPVAGFVALFPNAAGFWTFAFAAVLAWGIKAAVIEPIAMTALMQVFFKVIEGQEPDAEWDAKLSKMTGKFRKLKEKAETYIEPTPQPPTESTT